MKVRLSIYRKLFASYLLAILLVSGSVGTFFYINASESLFHQLQSRLSNSAALLSQALDASKLEDIRTPEDVDKPEYVETLKQLREFRATNEDIAFLYIMRLEDGRPVFVVDSDATEEQALPGHVYEENLPNLFKGFTEPAVDNELNTDEWGTFLSGYAPLRNGDGRYLVGIDMRANQVSVKMQRLRISGIVSLAASVLLALIFSRFLTGHFGRVITAVSERFGQISGGDLDKNLELKTNDELDVLIQSCNDMSRKLADAREQQRLAQEALKRSNDELEKRVAERTEELRLAGEKLRNEMADRERLEFRVRQVQKMESIGMLAGGIAHDFNNLLMGMLGYTDLALLKEQKGTEVRGYLEQIRYGALRASDLTKQILAYTGRGKFVLEPVDVNALVREMCDLTRVSLFEKVELHRQLENGLPWVKADSTQIRQVILNLITNAVESIRGDGGNVTVKTFRRTWKMDAARTPRLFATEHLPDGEYACLEVEDTGGGVPAEILERVFDPYFTTKSQGHGLGLAAVAGIVRGHHGGILLENTARGARFTVMFPAMEARPEIGEAVHRSGNIENIDAGVLVVDDEPDVRRVLEVMLNRLGVRVWCVDGGVAALERYKEEKGIDLVILDMSMPGMDGVETFRRLKEMDPASKVLLMTGFHAKEAVKRFGEAAPDGFLQKPFETEALKEAILQALGR